MIEALQSLIETTGIFYIDLRMILMWGVVGVLLWLAVAKKFEPLLLVPIGMGALLANLPTEGIINRPAGEVLSHERGIVHSISNEALEALEKRQLLELPRAQDRSKRPVILYIQPFDENGVPLVDGENQPVLHPIQMDASGYLTEFMVEEGDPVTPGQPLFRMHHEHPGGLFHYLSLGILLEIFPPLIFLGVGALTDFGPLIANPRTLLLGAAAQFGVFATFMGATVLFGMTSGEAAAIGIIGGADGPTSIFLANKLAPHLLAPIAVAAYSYMALVPVIQPPIMRLLTTRNERKIRMKSLRKVSKLEKLIFSVMVMMICIIIVPPASPLIFMLMFGNFLRECGVVERLSKTAQNELINVVTIFLGTCVGITMTGESFLQIETLKILALGVVAFGIATGTGILMAKAMNLVSKNKINPLIGSAGVSAVPMAARVSQVEGQKADPGNFLLMHAMGPNVAGVIGTAIAAGYFIAILADK